MRRTSSPDIPHPVEEREEGLVKKGDLLALGCHHAHLSRQALPSSRRCKRPPRRHRYDLHCQRRRECAFAYSVRHGPFVMDRRRVWESQSCQHLMCHLGLVEAPAETHRTHREHGMHFQILREHLFKVRQQALSPHFTNGLLIDTRARQGIC